MDTMDTTIKDFEGAIAELETIVKKLEEGDLPLESSLQLYERGVHLSRFCHAQLEQYDLRRRLGGVRARLVGVDGTLRAAAMQRHHGAEARLHTCAARLDSLSPLSVLGRGYAVVWDQSRTRVVRKAADVKPGDGVRVTLSEGELTCEVVKTDGPDN